MNDDLSSRAPRRVLLALCLALLCVWTALPVGAAHAQGGFGAGDPSAQADGPAVPRIEEAEAAFRQALGAFQSGEYDLALQRFRVVQNSYPLHQKTTAAALMAAKALYRQGDYARADERLSRFLRAYPSSSYVAEARRVRDYARQQLGLSGSEAGRETIQLGIALPLRDRDVGLTQAMFDGIALAVEAQNEGGAQTVRMIFRDTEGDPEAARRAMRALAEEGADVVIGPLYSSTARPAGAVAEEERLPLVAPLATDQGVSQGRRYVFQANPTMAMRGRQMARFAMQSLRKDRFGIVSQPEGTLSYQLAESFRAEAERQGGQVLFSQALPGLRAWDRLNERIPADQLASADIVYMPVSGGNASRFVQAALTALDRADVPGLRVLGNGEWDSLPIEQSASRYQTTYSTAFRVDASRPEVQAFIEQFRAATGAAPDDDSPTARRLAYTGYDVARFILGAAARRPTDTPDSPSLGAALREAPRYEGLSMRIEFAGENVNQALFYYRYRDGRLELLR